MESSAPTPPVPPGNRLTAPSGLCEHCRGPLPVDPRRRGEIRRFCSTRCRRLGWLERQRAQAVENYRAKVLAILAETEREP
jgi:endogenous inhibitor of DNA gyrase (YacG/DUF329 family)